MKLNPHKRLQYLAYLGRDRYNLVLPKRWLYKGYETLLVKALVRKTRCEITAKDAKIQIISIVPNIISVK